MGRKAKREAELKKRREAKEERNQAMRDKGGKRERARRGKRKSRKPSAPKQPSYPERRTDTSPGLEMRLDIGADGEPSVYVGPPRAENIIALRGRYADPIDATDITAVVYNLNDERRQAMVFYEKGARARTLLFDTVVSRGQIDEHPYSFADDLPHMSKRELAKRLGVPESKVVAKDLEAEGYSALIDDARMGQERERQLLLRVAGLQLPGNKHNLVGVLYNTAKKEVMILFQYCIRRPGLLGLQAEGNVRGYPAVMSPLMAARNWSVDRIAHELDVDPRMIVVDNFGAGNSGAFDQALKRPDGAVASRILRAANLPPPNRRRRAY